MFITLSPKGVVITFAAGFMLGALAAGSLRAHGAELPYCDSSTIANTSAIIATVGRYCNVEETPNGRENGEGGLATVRPIKGIDRPPV